MRIPAIRVDQWLDAWDSYKFDKAARQSKPEKYFYVCSMPAPLLRRLSGVTPRDTGDLRPRADDIGIQRGHEVQRSEDIGRFVRAGYPWATLNARDQAQFSDLRKPGWLPTAVVANIMRSSTVRGDKTPDPRDVVEIEDGSDGLFHLVLPKGSDSVTWERAGELNPVEIIDGQHRLFAFTEDENLGGDFELPVVLFHDLDISWQAYLFWTINITPKRINPSLAYDLYPLLRTERWLDAVPGPMAYRETRAQELTEALWSHPDSPWRDRIGMLGRERGKVTQAAFVRSLTLSFCRKWSGSRTGIGGFFGTGQTNAQLDVLPWNRAQQAAYLIAFWTSLARAIQASDADWAQQLRSSTPEAEVPPGHDAAFAGRYSMLATDQGVRGFLQVCNDISYTSRSAIPFRDWQIPTSAAATDHPEVSAALEELEQQDEIYSFITALTSEIASFDWRSAVTPGLPSDVEMLQSRYRGGSGYKQVRLQLLQYLARSRDRGIAETSSTVSRALGYDEG